MFGEFGDAVFEAWLTSCLVGINPLGRALKALGYDRLYWNFCDFDDNNGDTSYKQKLGKTVGYAAGAATVAAGYLDTLMLVGSNGLYMQAMTAFIGYGMNRFE